MNPSPLLSKPTFVSHFNELHHADYEAAVAKRVRDYLRSCWPWASEEQKEVYAENDGELLALMTCHRAPEHRAEIGTKYIVLYYAFDDFLEAVTSDKANKTVEGMKRVLLDGQPPENTLENLMYDLRSQMLSLGNNRSRGLANDAFALTVKYLELTINGVECKNALEHGLDSYLKYRRTECGFWFCIAVYAWELDLGLPPTHIMEDPDVDMLFSLSIDQLSLVNDMYSYRREAFELEGKHRKLEIAGEIVTPQHGEEYEMRNAVCILLCEDDVDEANVMEKLGALIRRKESDFIETKEVLRARFRDRTDDLAVIQEWATILTEWMSANAYWSATCRRYNNLEVDNM